MSADQPGPGTSLWGLYRWFIRRPSPLIITAAFVAATAGRVAVGRWSVHDVIIPAIVVAAEPFTEWVIHVGLLHWKPRRIGGFTVDPGVARKHRAHHAEPRDLELVMVPYRALLVGPPMTIGVGFLLLPIERAWMAAASGLAMLLAYEWIHYLIHAPYRPKTAWFRKRSRNHRLHHFKNERYWFGVTTNAGDRVLGTNPDERSVATSPTAKTLGVAA